MHPILFKIGKVTVNSYGAMMALGILTAMVISMVRGKKREFDIDHLTNIMMYGVLGGIIGAKLLFIITEIPQIIKNPSSIKYMITGGLVVYGAIIGGALTALIYCRRKHISFLDHFDLMVPSIAFAQSMGRIGCFLAGCCYGAETTGPLSVTFKESLIAPNGVSLYPTQIFSSIGDFIIGCVLLKFASKTRERGQTSGLYMILYSIGRFIIEFLRSDPRGNVGTLSTSQFICIFVFVSGIIVYNSKKIKSPTSNN